MQYQLIDTFGNFPVGRFSDQQELLEFAQEYMREEEIGEDPGDHDGSTTPGDPGVKNY